MRIFISKQIGSWSDMEEVPATIIKKEDVVIVEVDSVIYTIPIEVLIGIGFKQQ
jgi:hypothetical protein